MQHVITTSSSRTYELEPAIAYGRGSLELFDEYGQLPQHGGQEQRVALALEAVLTEDGRPLVGFCPDAHLL
jgi:hypothetical protein